MQRERGAGLRHANADKTPAWKRLRLLHEVAGEFASEEELAGLMCRETGKPILGSARLHRMGLQPVSIIYAEVGRSSRGQSLPTGRAASG